LQGGASPCICEIRLELGHAALHLSCPFLRLCEIRSCNKHLPFDLLQVMTLDLRLSTCIGGVLFTEGGARRLGEPVEPQDLMHF